MAKGIPAYLKSNAAYDPAQDPAALGPLDLYMAGQASAVVPDEEQKQKEAMAALAEMQAPQPTAEPMAEIPMPAAVEPQMPQGQQRMPVPENVLRQASLTGYENMAKQAALGQQQGIEALDRYIREFSQKPTEVDLSPLAAWADSLTWKPGRTYEVAKGMKPLTQEEKDKKLLDLQDKLQQRRGDYAKSMLSILESRQKGAESAKNERFLQGQDVRMFNQVRKEQSGLVKEATDFRGSYRNVEDAITPDKDGMVSVARVQQSLSQFARLMGEKGVLTDNDTGRQLAPTLELMIGRMQSILSSDPTAKIPAKNIEAMSQALQTAQQAFKESYRVKADTMRDSYLDPSSPYADKQWAPKMIEDVYKPLEIIGAPTKQSGGGDKQKRLEELRKKAGK